MAIDNGDLRALLKAVPMARDLEGRIWRMAIEGQHVFVAARTGGGKGSWIWALVLGLAPAWQAGLVKLWGADPKRLELAIAPGWWDHYADDNASVVEMLETAVEGLNERNAQLKGKARKFTPGPNTPLNVLIIDEMGYLAGLLPDKKLRERAQTAISTILALGRAGGYSVVGCVQDPRKETCGFRDLFPIRIAGGLDNATMVDLVLGDGMRDAGALCDRIPLPPHGAGVAYVLEETTRKPRLVRAPWCSDETIRSVLARYAVPALPEADAVKDEPLDITGPLPAVGRWQFKIE